MSYGAATEENTKTTIHYLKKLRELLKVYLYTWAV